MAYFMRFRDTFHKKFPKKTSNVVLFVTHGIFHFINGINNTINGIINYINNLIDYLSYKPDSLCGLVKPREKKPRIHCV